MKKLLTAQISFGSGVSHLDKLLFTKHLSVLIKSGLPLAEGLDILQEQTSSATLKQILKQLSADIKNGQSLSKSLSKHPKLFNGFYTSLIKVGESSGTLEENLKFLADHLAKDYANRKKVQGALLYPGLIFSAMLVMGGFISLFILPQLVDFFKAFDAELPFSTRVLLWFANLMKNHGVVIISLTIMFMVGLAFLVKLPKIKPLWHRKLLKLPLVGSMISLSQLGRFSRNLATLLKSGLPLISALEATIATISNLALKIQLEQAKTQVEKGKNLGVSLEKISDTLFPTLVSRMISVGEKTGKLEDNLFYLADFYDSEIDNVSKNLTTILEPILLISIGLVVGFVAIAIISPIYQLTGSLKR